MWLAENLKLEVTNYSRDLFGPRGAAHLGGGNDDGDGGEERTRRRPLATNQGRGSTVDYLQS